MAKRTRSRKQDDFPIENQENTPKNDIFSLIKFELKFKNKTQKDFHESIKKNDVTICIGSAGTGKTYLAVATAIKLLKDRLFKKIVIIKSVTPLKSEEIGYLKGTMQEKMEPFIYSFINNFEKLIGKNNTLMLRESGYIETLPIAYLRGINIDDAIVIVDEVQNISHDNLKTILTRLGENSKIVLLGDTEQVDIKYKKDSSLLKLANKIKSKPNENVGLIEFNEEDIVRHPLTGYFINLFKEEKKQLFTITCI